ncbi:MAG: hypothetical protein HY347_06925 [candidate division NC10 bacterium]|nr:hypothetical protein [candidate division NC10 bacterium]
MRAGWDSLIRRGPALLFVVGIALTLFVGSASALRTKDRMPPFTLKLFDGRELQSQDLQGQVVVLQFMASW